MAIITSPLAPEASFNQGATIEGAAGPSNGLYSSLVAAQRSNIDGPLAFQNLSNVESSRSESLVKQGLSSGHSAGDLARATSNHNHSLGKQRSLRPRAENQNLAHRPRAQLSRTKTDFVHDLPPTRSPEADELEQIRHGWEDQYSSSEYLSVLSSSFFMYFTEKRHETGGKPNPDAEVKPPEKWREKDRQKTVSAALVICLNIGVDPPDVIKTIPTASLECWIDTTNTTTGNPKLMEGIGKKLQDQYENMSIKTRYKQYLDPSIEETKKFCVSLRRNAKEERILFHYNGHGVPLPTSSGEFWVFNKDYTQYIPVSMFDLQGWLGGPSLYIYDVSRAGNIVANFQRLIDKHLAEDAETLARNPNAVVQNYSSNIQLAACGKNEMLPTNPSLPADLFTCCLTTPIEISMRFHVLENPLPSPLTLKDVMKVPGRAAERRSPMGELNWILTAITDTIAWNMLPSALFRQLFRQDLMVAALFRNFLVAQRIMRVYGCHPQSTPEIPDTHDHPLWEAWDLAIEMVLAQLPTMLAAEESGQGYDFQHSTFFSEQLIAFEMYLNGGAPEDEAPTQLPIVLQVLLSQAHRVKALILLSRFLDLGPWAVSLALTIGIFPYVVKLLQSPANELKTLMIFIWARIVAVDIQAVQQDLLKDNGYQYFTSIILLPQSLPIQNPTEHRAMAAFVTAMFCRGFPQGKNVCLSPDLIDACIRHTQNPENPLLRQWSCLCISMLWQDFPEAKWVGIRISAHVRLCSLAMDPVPEVRAAAIHALTNFLGIPGLTPQVAQNEEVIASALLEMRNDGNAMVRMELIVFFSVFVKRYRTKCLVAAYETLVKEKATLVKEKQALMTSGLEQHVKKPLSSLHDEDSDDKKPSYHSQNSIQGIMWYHLLTFTVDPHPDVAQAAGQVVDYVYEVLCDGPLAEAFLKIVQEIQELEDEPVIASRQPSAAPSSKTTPAQASTGPQQPSRNESFLSAGLRRNASVASALKFLGLGGSEPSDSQPSTPGAPHHTMPQQRSIGLQRPGVPPEWSTPPNQNDHRSTTAKYQKAKVPLPKLFEKISPDEPLKLPLKSVFFEWSIEVSRNFSIPPEFYDLIGEKYFREPQTRQNEADEPGSNDYNARLWRRARNEKVLEVTQPLKGVAGSTKWDNSTAFFNNETQPSKMCFHQYEDHLAIADDRDTICIWNWEKSARLNRFSNGNPVKTSVINEARFINEDDNALLMTGSSDGVIKIFRNYESPQDIELVTAFTALKNLIPSTKNAGIVLDWQQGQGKLLVAGDVKTIKVWNAATETYITDIPARSGSCITSLTSDQVAGSIFAAGYGDGAIRIFDTRLKPAMAMIKHWRRHKQWITNIHMQRGGFRELVSGSRNGEVRLWDLRNEQPLREIVATEDTMRTLSVHEHAPVFATGSDTHALTVFNVNGTAINTIRPYSPLLAGKSSPIACSAFHPHKMQLATGSLGHGNVEVFSCIANTHGA